MAEGLADSYFEKLNSDTNPGATLAKFYSELFNLTYGVKTVVMFNRLVKLYGKTNVFFSILEIGDTADHTNIYGLINYICKKRLEKSSSSTPVDLLEDTVIASEKKVKKALKTTLIIRNPFDE
jgi:hypothetical protein